MTPRESLHAFARRCCLERKVELREEERDRFAEAVRQFVAQKDWKRWRVIMAQEI